MTRCRECRGAAELLVTNSTGVVLAYCIACAKRLALSMGLPALASAAADAERRKTERD